MSPAKITFEIDRADLGMIRVAFLDAIAEATQRRNALDGIDNYEDIVADIDHRIAVINSVKTQIADYEIGVK